MTALPSWLTPARLRLAKFAVVGTTGVFVNEAVLWVCYRSLLVGLGDGETFLGGNRLSWSGAIAIFVSILTNFLLNDRWTWNDRRKRPGLGGFLARMGQYYLVAGVAGVVQWATLKLLTESVGLHYLLSNMVGIVAGMAINFVVNNVWTFRNR